MSPQPSPAPLPQPPHQHSARQKQKPVAIGIAAGAEDAKYQAKYKELKRKVKDIEADNDKLQFKVLQTKLSIRRMKMERAILYERLSIVPPSPNLQDRLALPVSAVPPHQPSSRPVPANHQHREMRDHPSAMDLDQVHPPPEHIRPQGNPRVSTGHDSRSVPVLDNSVNSAVASSPHMLVHSPRRISGGHDSSRHNLPPLGQLPPVHQYEGGHSHSNSHASPSLHHTHPSSSHSRNRSHSSSHSRSHQVPPQPYRGGTAHHHQYPESLPPVQQPLHSPPLSEREHSRRSGPHEYVGPHSDPHGYDRHQTHPQLSPTLSSEVRSSGRIHAHQRLGPGTYINEYHDKQRDLEREREWERERERHRDREYNRGSRDMTSSSHMHSPHSVHRSRAQIDRGDYEHHVSSRSREEQPYYQEVPQPSGYPRLSRSDTPGSGSGSGSGGGGAEVPSRPESRTQYYDRDRTRSSYRLRPVSQPNEDAEFAHEEGRSQTRTDRTGAGVGGGGNFSLSEQNRPALESRKRSRNEMEVDSDHDVGDGPSGAGGAALYSTGRLQEDRGSKRYHREHPRRSVDNHEDARMGPS